MSLVALDQSSPSLDLMFGRRGGYSALDPEEAMTASFWRQVMSDLNDSMKRRRMAIDWLHSEDFYWWASTSLDLHDKTADAFRDRLLSQAGTRKASAFCVPEARAV